MPTDSNVYTPTIGISSRNREYFIRLIDVNYRNDLCKSNDMAMVVAAEGEEVGSMILQRGEWNI